MKSGNCRKIKVEESAGSHDFAQKELSVTGVRADIYEAQNLIGFTTWETNTYYFYDAKHDTVINTLQKSKSNVIPVSLDPTGNIDTAGSGDFSESKKSNNVSIEDCLIIIGEKNHIDSNNSNSSSDIVPTQKLREAAVSPLAMKRINYMLQNNWIVLGFADGSVTVSKL